MSHMVFQKNIVNVQVVFFSFKNYKYKIQKNELPSSIFHLFYFSFFIECQAKLTGVYCSVFVL